MLNRNKHQQYMGLILEGIATDATLAPLLGFKGGTCAYLFYNLPRFSVDLDFDLLDPDKTSPQEVLEKIRAIAAKHGDIRDAVIKHYTILVEMSYGTKDHNVKVEISKRSPLPNIREYFEPKDYLGFPLLAAVPDYLFATKLAALTNRSYIAVRDIFDIHYYASKVWDINHELLHTLTGKTTTDQLSACIATIEKTPNEQILDDLGELLDPKQKKWAKDNLKSDTIFLLKNYQAALR